MSAAGLKGTTKKNLLSFLKLGSIDELNSCFSHYVNSLLTQGGDSSVGPILSSANGVWIDRSLSFKPGYKDLINGVYKSYSGQADFKYMQAKAAGEINEWARRETRGLIENLIEPGAIRKYSRLILANALHFKGTWETKFDASRTSNHTFYFIHNDTPVQECIVEIGDEENTKIADASNMMMTNNSSCSEPESLTKEDQDFVADRPFFNLIREDVTGVVTVLDPRDDPSGYYGSIHYDMP
ncbi:OLC1v1017774C1 [Oldenlandia corymbosa var. corymbosa]|uniref:OLC1v1017774C1 n=1 Tax=Oldenlandia corymbosa var. corymbosa TaxID=529605 RepID=A0AAV1EAH1_OLDCO|nr:OLC1v1017774C1 [Oldenlandia corymbosa var. corymbosa]